MAKRNISRLIACGLLLTTASGCVSTQWADTHWRAHRYSERLDQLAEKRMDPNYYREVKLGNLTIHVCGPAALKSKSPTRGQCSYPGHVWVLGDADYISQWGLGHELAHQLGYDPDKF